MSNKLLVERTTSTRLKIGSPLQSEVKIVANWRGVSTAQLLASCKTQQLSLMVGVHKTDDTIVCAHLAYVPGISAYSGSISVAERNQILTNLTEAQVIWVYTNPDYRNQGYYTEFANALKDWIFTNYSGYTKTVATKIDPTMAGSTYIKSHLADVNYTTPEEEFDGSDYEKAELTRTQYETDNP